MRTAQGTSDFFLHGERGRSDKTYFMRQGIVKAQNQKVLPSQDFATPINLGETWDGVFLILFLEWTVRVVCAVGRAHSPGLGLPKALLQTSCGFIEPFPDNIVPQMTECV